MSSRYAQVTDQGKEKVSSILSAAKGPGAHRTTFEKKGDGVVALILKVGELEINASHWLAQPELAAACCHALEAASPQKALSTISGAIGALSISLFSYVAEKSPSRIVRLSELDRVWMSKFIAWLGRENEKGSPKWTVGTRRSFLGSVKLVFSTLRSQPDWQ